MHARVDVPKWAGRFSGRRVILALSVGLIPVVVAACGSSTPKAATTTTAAQAASTTTTAVAGSTTSTAPGTPTPIYEVRTGKIPGLGTVLVDGQGFTLYLFVPDKQSGKSTCYGTCASGWPPLLLPAGVHAPLAGPGVNTKVLATTSRTDGTTQVTYNGWPLYLWVNDSAPGQATGQGIDNLGGLWYVVSPNGHAILRK